MVWVPACHASLVFKVTPCNVLPFSAESREMPRVMRRSRQASWSVEERRERRGDLGKRKRDVAGGEETAPDRKHRRREEEEAVSTRTSR